MQHRYHITAPSDVPSAPHYAIFKFETITIPGDERSKLHPGHGYPEHTETKVVYMAFSDESAWKDEVARLTKNHSRFSAALVHPADIKVEVTTSVEIRGLK